jgi:NADH-quinone oxidoreductase subunit C
MDVTTITTALMAALPEIQIEVAPATDRPTIVIGRERLLDVCRLLRDDATLRFTVLTDMTAVDFWPGEPRFELIYHLLSPDRPSVLRLKVRLPGDAAFIPTAQEVWPSAGWLEREVWDMFGIAFDGHPDLRRLLMPEDWEGHPLRKDYPVQVRMKPKVFEPLQLSEEEFKAKLQADRHVRRGSRGSASEGSTDGDPTGHS